MDKNIISVMCMGKIYIKRSIFQMEDFVLSINLIIKKENDDISRIM